MLTSKVAKVAKSKQIKKDSSSKQASPSLTPAAKIPRNRSLVMNDPKKNLRRSPKRSESQLTMPVPSENSSVAGSKKRGLSPKKLSIRISKNQKSDKKKAD